MSFRMNKTFGWLAQGRSGKGHALGIEKMAKPTPDRGGEAVADPDRLAPVDNDCHRLAAGRVRDHMGLGPETLDDLRDEGKLRVAVAEAEIFRADARLSRSPSRIAPETTPVTRNT